ncbi:hypothetical protein MSG28_008711 [Choristoneura fumiferana]|uniref:Uncharacterized protein n=1 Tax=Choristoneura fumiferana TaxID=7141 RepID=A0ACC0J7Q2_CHOFU|nr:hypothetical protein MSG28_008711 [Choristoneura fumiferana]
MERVGQLERLLAQLRRRCRSTGTGVLAKPCVGGVADMRAEQCSTYDRRPFRGRFYTWVPYIDGDSPCTLNCRPLGKHFYASLSLVADGTPCTRPGFRAICVQGACKYVDGLLAAPAPREMLDYLAPAAVRSYSEYC